MRHTWTIKQISVVVIFLPMTDASKTCQNLPSALVSLVLESNASIVHVPLPVVMVLAHDPFKAMVPSTKEVRAVTEPGSELAAPPFCEGAPDL